jgi:hypothetical protein
VRLQVAHQGGTDEATVAGDVDFGGLVHKGRRIGLSCYSSRYRVMFCV